MAEKTNKDNIRHAYTSNKHTCIYKWICAGKTRKDFGWSDETEIEYIYLLYTYNKIRIDLKEEVIKIMKYLQFSMVLGRD